MSSSKLTKVTRHQRDMTMTALRLLGHVVETIEDSNGQASLWSCVIYFNKTAKGVVFTESVDGKHYLLDDYELQSLKELGVDVLEFPQFPPKGESTEGGE